ncbi:hypothetical protein [Leptothrix ochracea]|uniref:hypothetical protein n=2 Tax=Leptothrix ochracea TaxID=735331 RepID=UPI0034E1A705
MTPSSSAATYKDWLESRRIYLAAMSTPQLVTETLSFFQTIRCAGLAPGAESDMLLYQWGVYNWGHGEHFELDITRQFIAEGRVGDDALSQLRVTAYFQPTEDLRRIKAGNRWCEGVDQVEQLRRFVQASEAYKAVSQVAPQRVVAEWSPV